MMASEELLIEEEEYKGYTIKISLDDLDLESPREWDNLGTMVCWHGRYNLGDEHQFGGPEELFEFLANETDPSVEERSEYWNSGNGWTRLVNEAEREGLGYTAAQDTANEKRRQIIDKAIDENVLMLPLYIYDHSGVTMRTAPFSCPWDSGQVGFIYVTKEQVRKEFFVQRVSKRHWRKAEEILKSEVKVYDQYLRGEVYRFAIEDEEGEVVDSCSGFLGDSDIPMQEAKSIIDAITKENQDSDSV